MVQDEPSMIMLDAQRPREVWMNLTSTYLLTKIWFHFSRAHSISVMQRNLN
jgi:hypothetical protein